MTLRLKLAAVGLTAAFVSVACGANQPSSTGSSTPSPAAVSSASGADTKAADLRIALDNLLGEHVILAAKATGAALGGRTPEFNAYGALLNTNGTDLGAAIGSVYGNDAATQFNQLWSAHNGFFVDYTTGVATKDSAKQSKAVADLTGTYVPQFSKFLSDATGLPNDAVTGLVKQHVLDTKQVVDDQAAKDYTKEYADLDTAYGQLYTIGDALASAISKQHKDKFPGDSTSKAAGLRSDLNKLLQEHLYIATMATDAALGGRTPEFNAAGGLLNTNGTTLGGAIGSLYGADAGTKFNAIWSAHNGFFVDYTTGVATKDAAKQSKAVSDLTGTYIPQFSDFIAGATGLPNDAVAGLTKDHVLSTKAVVDDQGAKDFAKASTDDRTAAQHMQKIADPLASAIVKKLPDKFSS